MPYRLIFSLIAVGIFVVSLPKEYSSQIVQIGSSLFSSLLNRSDTSQNTYPVNKEREQQEQEEQVEYQETLDHSASVLEEKYSLIVSKVIFHTHNTWTHTVWVDKGSKTKDLPFPLKKNCPALIEDTLIGIVDFVGEYASRIRLISDPSVHPSVRVARGSYTSRRLFSITQELQKALRNNPNIMPKEQLSTKLIALLDVLSSSLHYDIDMRLAKGELQGSESDPAVFRGSGFNYDFDDEEGKKMDLRTGKRSLCDERIPLIKPGDILTTSGLDGFFPKNINVASVEKVFPLEEGAIAYTILAKSLAPEFSSPEYISILPAQPEEPLYPPTKEKLLLQCLHHKDQ